jgi:hypothetical protein
MARALATLPLIALAFAVAAAPATASPKIGRTAWAKPVSGKILLREKGKSSFKRLRGEKTIPIGSALNASNGRVRVRTAKNKRGALQAGVFRGGTFTVEQKRSSPLTTLRLTGDDGCTAAQKAGTVHAARSRRRLFGSARGRFRSRGRSSTATVRGTVWSTEDLCTGATLTRAYSGGEVDAKSKASSQRLEPGQASEDYCQLEPIQGISDLYCISLFSDPENDVFGFAIATFDPGALGLQPPSPDPPRDVDVCIRNPQGTEGCRNYALERIDEGFYLQSDGCSPVSGTGTYTVRWRMRGQDLPVPLHYVSTQQGAGIGCVNRPPGEPSPARTGG